MADDVVQVQSTGSSVQNIDNAQLTRPDTTIVDRQRVTIKSDTDFQQPAAIEALLMEALALQVLILKELRVHTHFIREGFMIPEDVDQLRADPALLDLTT